MHFYPHQVYHVYNRGNNRQPIFFYERNYWYFLDKVQKHVLPHCDLLAWCLMPNHFHFLLYTNEQGCETLTGRTIQTSKLIEGFRLLLSNYCKAINVQENRVGSLFQQKTKSKHTCEDKTDYSLTAFHYIHQNPLKAALVSNLEDWEFSSFRDYAGFGKKNVCNMELAREILNLNFKTFVADSYSVLDDDAIGKIF